MRDGSRRVIPLNWAGIRLVPDEVALRRDGSTRDRFFSVMDGFVRERFGDEFSNPEPGVYCIRYFGVEPGVREDLYALMFAMGESEIMREYAGESTWSVPGEGTRPLTPMG